MKILVGGIGLLALAGLAFGHDMWLESGSFVVDRPGREIRLLNGNGTIFKSSENAVSVDRIASLTVLDPRGSRLEAPSASVEEPWLMLGFRPESEGNFWVGLSTRPSSIRMSGSEFTEYLVHDGIPNVLQDRSRKGISDRDEVERYSKYAKAYLQVGQTRSANFDVPLGLEIEIVPLVNPYLLRPGDDLPVRVLFRGLPLAGLTLHAGCDVLQGQPSSTVTDPGGMAKVRISTPGRWYVRGIHLIQVDREDFSYESFWATLTFELKG